jgi:hypothetical protein
MNRAESARARWSRPEYRARQLAARRQRGNDPEWIAEALFSHVEPEPTSGCLIWVGSRFDSGYGSTTLAGERLAHRASWKIFRGPLLETDLLRHRCDLRPCINPVHLIKGTHIENMADMAERGRAYRPVGVKITIEDAAAIRSLRADGQSYRALAQRFEVGPASIRAICRGERWTGPA